MTAPALRIGIDVGGTNTDAVLLAGTELVAARKTPTTRDVTSGVRHALRHVITAGRVDPAALRSVVIGTTHFTNAVIEARALEPVAAVRLCGPASTALPPFVDWPERLLSAVHGDVFLVDGGQEFDGRAIAPLDEACLRHIAEHLAARSIRNVAVASVFAPLDPAQERHAGAILRQANPALLITLSHELGRIGLLERENAAILNAALRPLAGRTTEAFLSALRQEGVAAPLYISQNDGTVAHVDFVRQYPVATFSAGPTNSMRGAAVLSKAANAIVVDVGGTTTDVGALVDGFPREAPFATRLGGVRTNLRMPDLVSIGLGGGSLVSADGAQVGPQSVGYEITEMARVFGGEVLTATDIAVAAGFCEIGDPARVARLDRSVVERALGTMRRMLAEAVESVRIAQQDPDLLLVGGGAILFRRGAEALGRIAHPPHAEVANAVGAAIAQIGAECDQLVSYAQMPREAALGEACARARERAVTAGADPDSLSVVDIEEVPLSYLPNQMIRIRAKVIGDLALPAPGKEADGRG